MHRDSGNAHGGKTVGAAENTDHAAGPVALFSGTVKFRKMRIKPP